MGYTEYVVGQRVKKASHVTSSEGGWVHETGLWSPTERRARPVPMTADSHDTYNLYVYIYFEYKGGHRKSNTIYNDPIELHTRLSYLMDLHLSLIPIKMLVQ